MQKETVINGIAIAPGVVIDEVFLFTHEEFEVPQYMVKAEEAEQEITAYHSALDRVMQEMTSSLAELKGEESEIMNAHIMILNDSEIDSQIQDYICTVSRVCGIDGLNGRSIFEAALFRYSGYPLAVAGTAPASKTQRF